MYYIRASGTSSSRLRNDIHWSLTNPWVLPLIDHHLQQLKSVCFNDANLFLYESQIFKFCGSKFFLFCIFYYNLFIEVWLFFSAFYPLGNEIKILDRYFSNIFWPLFFKYFVTVNFSNKFGPLNFKYFLNVIFQIFSDGYFSNIFWPLLLSLTFVVGKMRSWWSFVTISLLILICDVADRLVFPCQRNIRFYFVDRSSYD